MKEQLTKEKIKEKLELMVKNQRNECDYVVFLVVHSVRRIAIWNSKALNSKSSDLITGFSWTASSTFQLSISVLLKFMTWSSIFFFIRNLFFIFFFILSFKVNVFVPWFPFDFTIVKAFIPWFIASAFSFFKHLKVMRHLTFN